MMALRYIESQATWQGERIDDILHPNSIEQLWTDEELAAIGLERVPAAVPDDSPPPPRKLGTFVEFMDFFSPEDQVRILTASKADPALELLIMRATAQNQVDLDSPLLGQAFTPLLAAGIITQQQLEALLARGFD